MKFDEGNLQTEPEEIVDVKENPKGGTPKFSNAVIAKHQEDNKRKQSEDDQGYPNKLAVQHDTASYTFDM